MDRYIGLGAHASSCTLGVLGPGRKRLGSHVVETNAKALIEVLRSIPGPLRTRNSRTSSVSLPAVGPVGLLAIR